MKKEDRDDKTSTGKTKVIRWEEQATKLTLSKCKLTITNGEMKGKEFILSQPVIRVGTKKENELVVKDETMSRTHFEIHQSKEGYILKDQDSLNGTFINGVRVKEGFLTAGAVVRAGKTEMKFSPQDETFDIIPSKKNKVRQFNRRQCSHASNLYDHRKSGPYRCNLSH
jgi:pSer/pThr/pTyr-binding forkhead associated (FHA) protein